MSEKIGELDTLSWDGTATLIVTEFVGPSRLPDRRCLQIGDSLQFDRPEVAHLRDMLSKWLGDGQQPMAEPQPRLLRLPWGDWVDPDDVRHVTVAEHKVDDEWISFVAIFTGSQRKGWRTASDSLPKADAQALADECARIINEGP